VFFTLSDWLLGLIILAVLAVASFLGAVLGSRLRSRSATLQEPLGIVHGAVIGVVGLVLAFALTLAVGRYEDRRAALVDDANTIGTTYLRAQTLAEPERTASLELLRRYAQLAVRISDERPGSSAIKRTTRDQEDVHRGLWRLAGRSLARAPDATAPRLYVDSLNTMIDQQTTRLSALNNRIPGAVLALELIAAAIGLATLALLVAVLGRGHATVAFVGILLAALLLVTFDLDRPTRGLIKIPTAPLTAVESLMAQPPAAAAP
jgi:hypothetical protein